MANANAKRPHSLTPICFCTFSFKNVIVQPECLSKQQECSTTCELGLLYRLSRTLTVPELGFVEIVVQQTQCPPVFSSCMNGDLAGATSKQYLEGSLRPSIFGNLFLSNAWPAQISVLFNQVCLSSIALVWLYCTKPKGLHHLYHSCSLLKSTPQGQASFHQL